MARRARTTRWVWLAALVGALTGLPGVAVGQVPDTVPRDTAIVPIPPGEVGDTLPADSLLDTLPDSLREAAVFPVFPAPFPTGWAAARWEWSRQELLRYRGLSLLELLERLPGLTSVRTGSYGRPAGLTALGGGGARLRVFWDGLELDPLNVGALDLQHIGLVDLERVRVERGLDEVRVELVSFRLEEARPYSEVEVGAGLYDTKLLRAVLSRPFGSRNVLTGAYDLVSTDGIAINEPFQHTGARLTWSHTPSETTALRLDLLRSGVERGGAVAPLEQSRLDLVLRGRAEPLPGLEVDALVARGWLDADDSTTTRSGVAGSPQAVDTVRLDHAAVQGMLRAGYRHRLGYLEATARLRDSDGVPVPSTDLSARALLQPAALLSATAEARAALLDGRQAVSLGGTARLGPVAGLSAFASLSAGERWVALARDTLVTVELPEAGLLQLRRRELRPRYAAEKSAVNGLRAGAEWAAWDAAVGAAVVAQDAALIAPFGLAFDRSLVPAAGGRATGFELFADLPVPWTGGAVRLDGWYQRWADIGQRPYLPAEQARGAVELHGLFFDGQLEPTLRVEALYRGSTIVPAFGGADFSEASQPYTLLNLYLQIRIMDVRAFLFLDNLLNNREALDLPGGQFLAPRLFYGVRWFFRD